MNILLIFPGFIVAFVVVLLYEYRIRLMRKEPNKNKVHFYVARNKNGLLCLYMGKPLRCNYSFIAPSSKGITLLACEELKWYHLDKDDYANLKWEDEPVEVSVNMED